LECSSKVGAHKSTRIHYKELWLQLLLMRSAGSWHDLLHV